MKMLGEEGWIARFSMYACVSFRIRDRADAVEFTLNRRDVLLVGLAAGITRLVRQPLRAEDDKRQVMTVRGAILPEEMGPTLPHEHVLVDFGGANEASRDRYDADEVHRIALPHLRRIRVQGIRTLVDCTPAYVGRDPGLLRRLSESSGLSILTPTGYYGANRGKYIPDHARTESADELASRWLREWREGIEGTGIRPGFIKLGADAGPLPEIHRKLVQAAGRTHLASGLTIAAHSGDGAAAMGALEILRQEGIDGSAFIWVHANAEADQRLHVRAAEAGAWVEFDGISPKEIDRHVNLVRSMKVAGHLGRVLVSHDAGWYHVGEPGGGAYRPYDTLMADFVPALRAAKLTEAEVRRLTVDNPADAFEMRVRPAR
jgi:phosphotriesterase-related protein